MGWRGPVKAGRGTTEDRDMGEASDERFPGSRLVEVECNQEGMSVLEGQRVILATH